MIPCLGLSDSAHLFDSGIGFLHGLPEMLFQSPDWESYCIPYVLSSLASTPPQFRREYTRLLPDTHHLVKSVWFQHFLAFLVWCHWSPSLWEHAKLRSCMSPEPPLLSPHSIPTRSFQQSYLRGDQESKPMATCSLHLSVQTLSLAALWTAGLWPAEQGRFMILWQMFLPHLCSRQGDTYSLLSAPAPGSVSASSESGMNFRILL